MRYRKLDAAGDYTLGTGSDFHVDTPAAVAQAVQTRLLLTAGEWFLDVTEGTPWNTQILGKYTANSYDLVIKERILKTPGVVQLANYASTLDAAKRQLSVTATIDTIYGQAFLQANL